MLVLFLFMALESINVITIAVTDDIIATIGAVHIMPYFNTHPIRFKANIKGIPTHKKYLGCLTAITDIPIRIYIMLP